MPITWKRIRAVGGKNFRKGAFLYELSEEWEVNASGVLCGVRFIIVAVTDRTSDHGLPETQCFAANKDGDFFGGFRMKHDDGESKWTQRICKLDHESAAYAYSRVVGRHDYDESLRRLTRQSYITKEERRIQDEAEARQQRERDQPWEFGCPPEFDLTSVRF